jgi:serine/threonine-protein kinase
LGSDLLRAVLGAKRALAEATVLTPLAGLTPDGVLLASSGDVMISGLGLAMLARPIDLPALLAYRAPEHFSGSVPDERSEVYSVGVLLWELLAGRNPLVDGARTPADLLQQIRTVGLPRLDRAAPASLSPAVAALVMQAVARDPAQRIPNLGALANALMALGKAHNVRLSEVLKAIEAAGAGAARPAARRARCSATASPRERASRIHAADLSPAGSRGAESRAGHRSGGVSTGHTAPADRDAAGRSQHRVGARGG